MVLSCLCQCFKSGQQQQDSWPFGRTKRCFEPGTAQIMEAPLCWGLLLCVVGKPKGFCVGQWSRQKTSDLGRRIISFARRCPFIALAHTATSRRFSGRLERYSARLQALFLFFIINFCFGGTRGGGVQMSSAVSGFFLV